MKGGDDKWVKLNWYNFYVFLDKLFY
jgi:hypothetical protein